MQDKRNHKQRAKIDSVQMKVLANYYPKLFFVWTAVCVWLQPASLLHQAASTDLCQIRAILAHLTEA